MPHSRKLALRQRLRQQRLSLSREEHQHFSLLIHHQLCELLPLLQAQTVLAYRSMSSEVDTSLLHQHHFSLPVYAPVCQAQTRMRWRQSGHEYWQPSSLGALEPQHGQWWQPDTSKTCLICPLLGFDRQGQRIGMGAGYFDRWLAEFNSHIQWRIGLAFSLQEVDSIPVEAHDQALDMIITEKEVIQCQKA